METFPERKTPCLDCNINIKWKLLQEPQLSTATFPMERAMPKPWSLYRLYKGGFIFPSQTFHWTSPPHTHTNTNTEFRCWLSLTAKRQQKQQRFETLSVSIDLDATGRWLSINAQIGCFEALHQEIPSSEKFIHRPGKQPPSGSTNRQSENSQKKSRSNVSP